MQSRIIAVRDTGQLQRVRACHLQCICQRSAHSTSIAHIVLGPGADVTEGLVPCSGHGAGLWRWGEGQHRVIKPQKGLDWKVP